MLEDLDTCRICSAPAEPDQPLFHPCKCSGTIRYVHQDCLKEWLAHSKKTSCDVCMLPYTFAKVYDPAMPQQIPLHIQARRLILQALSGILLVLRAALVSIVWLCLLPWLTLWTWRIYFAMGEATAWWIANRPRPGDSLLNSTFLAPLPLDFALSESNITNTTTNLDSHLTNDPDISPVLIGRLILNMLRGALEPEQLSQISADVFKGQLISAAVIAICAASILLREWIMHFAGPGILDGDGDPPPPPPAPAVVPPVVPVQAPAPEPEPVAPLAEVHDQEGHPVVPFVDDNKASWEENGVRREGTPARDPQESLSELLENLTEEEAAAALEALEGAEYRAAEALATPISELYRELMEYDEDALPIPPPRGLDESPTNDIDSPEEPVPVDSEPTAGPSHSQPSPRPGPLAPFARRPPLPSSAAPSPHRTPARESAPSPNRTSYRAPEDFALGDDNGYFAGQGSGWKAEDEEVDEAIDPMDIYFRERENVHETEGAELRFTDDLAGPINKEKEEETWEPIGQDADDMPPLLLEVDSSDEGSDDLGDRRLRVMEQPPVPPGVGVVIQDEIGHVVPHGEDFGDDPWDQAFDDVDDDVRDDFIADIDIIEHGQGNERREEPLVVNPPIRPPVFPDAFDEPLDIAAARQAAEDDGELEGMLEAIGFRGPLGNLVQNAMFVTVSLDAVIGAAVWIPFMIGKTTALLILDPPRLWWILHLPVRIIQLFTDPIVDGLAWLVLKTFNLLAGRGSAVSEAVPPIEPETSNGTLVWYTNMMSAGLHKIGFLASDNSTVDNGNVTYPWIDRVFENEDPVVQQTVTLFADFGRKTRIFAVAAKEWWTRHALGDSVSDNAFAIALGYNVLAILLAVYLNVLTLGSMRNAGRAVRQTVHNQLLVLKVALFMSIEVIFFPMVCGALLCLCIMWAFPIGASSGVIAYAQFSPATSAFWCWLVGGYYVQQLALIVNGSREIVRPGAFWFVQDPHEREVNPIRDILERSSWLQLKKLGSSAEIYGFTVILAALTIKLIMWVVPGLAPFTWTPRSSVASPYDMFLLVLVMPYIERYIRLEKFLLSRTAWFWLRFAKRLQLTSYLYGSEPLTEEEGGQWKRVPATDAIPINPKIQLVVTVDKDGTPQNAEARRMFEAQDQLTINAGRDPKKDYQVVYYPPHFRWRLLLFFACSWLILISCIAVVMVLSIPLGRGLLGLIWSKPIHDGHTFLTGFAALWLALTFGRALERMDLRRQRQPGWEGPGASWILWTIKCGLHWLGSVTYMGVVLGVIIPTLVALVVDVYIIYPMRLALSPGTQVRFKMVEAWMLGVMYCVLHIGRWRRSRTRLGRGLDRIVHNGWTNPDPFRATTEVISPVLSGLSLMVFGPAATVAMLNSWTAVEIDSRALFTVVYPGIFVVACMAATMSGLSSTYQTWLQHVRDKEFVVEMRLQNREPNAPQEQGPPKEDVPILVEAP